MKTSILLKFLQNSAPTPNFNYKHKASRKNEAGFTILELLVIVILLGTLAAIAAPGWLGFINRQRVRTVNDRVFQSLRLAQSEAKRTKKEVKITFSQSDPPEVTFNPPVTTGGATQQLNAGGEVKAGQVKPLSVASCPLSGCTPATSITFNYNGVVDPNNSDNPELPLVVTVAPANSASNTKARQCAIVETLIGAMRTAEGDACPQ